MNRAQKALLRRVKPRRGLVLRRWPVAGIRYPLTGLSQKGLVDWAITWAAEGDKTELVRTKPKSRRWRR